MPRRPKPDNEGGPMLKDVRLPVIEVVCTRCGRRDLLERKALVERFGAGVSFTRLRRRLAMGCERLCHTGGDQCGTRFPCVDGEDQNLRK